MRVLDITFKIPGKFYSDSPPPRFVNDGKYHLEWSRDGVYVEECPEGSYISGRSLDKNRIELHPHTLIEWKSFNFVFDTNRNYESYEIYDCDNKKQYNMEIRNRDEQEWIDKCDKGKNVNKEAMYQIAAIYEKSIANGKEYRNLIDIMPKGIDDELRSEILKHSGELAMRRLSNTFVSADNSHDVDYSIEIKTMWNLLQQYNVPQN